MGKSVLVRLARRCVVERMGCGISHLPSGTAGQDLLLGLVYLCVCVCVFVHVPSGVGMCAWCVAHRCVSMSLGLCGYVCAWVSVQTVRTGIWLLSPSSTTLCHGDSCTQGQGWCGANWCRGTHCSALPACTRQGFGAGATLGAEKRTGLWAKEVVRKGLTGGTAVCCINVTLIFERYT